MCTITEKIILTLLSFFFVFFSVVKYSETTKIFKQILFYFLQFDAGISNQSRISRITFY